MADAAGKKVQAGHEFQIVLHVVQCRQHSPRAPLRRAPPPPTSDCGDKIRSTNWSVRSAAPFLLPSYSFCCLTQRPDRKQHPGSNSGLCCTSTKTFALFLKMQLLKRKTPSFPWDAGVWPEQCLGAGRGMRVGASVRCWSLPVSCQSLPVDDAKARLFSAILRKWKILSGEIQGGKKASGAQCCRGIYCKHPEKSADHFVNLSSNRVRDYVGFQEFKQTYVYLCIPAVLAAQAQHHTLLPCHFLTLSPAQSSSSSFPYHIHSMFPDLCSGQSDLFEVSHLEWDIWQELKLSGCFWNVQRCVLLETKQHFAFKCC